MAWVGDIGRIGLLARRVERLGQTPMRAREQVAESIKGLIEDEFSAGADPYGTAWAPLAESTIARGRTWPALTNTREMRDDVKVTVAHGAVIDVKIPHPAGVHQTGWSGPQGSGPARPILPNNRMPPLWSEAIKAAVKGAWNEAG